MIKSIQALLKFELLYKYTQTTRSMFEKLDNEPEWMQNIRTKLGKTNRDIEKQFEYK